MYIYTYVYLVTHTCSARGDGPPREPEHIPYAVLMKKGGSLPDSRVAEQFS